jgi:hypothetical protein
LTPLGVGAGLPWVAARDAASAADPDREEADPVVDPVDPLPPAEPGTELPVAGTPTTGTVTDELGPPSGVRAVGSAFASSTFAPVPSALGFGSSALVGTGVGGTADDTGVGVTAGVELGVGWGV